MSALQSAIYDWVKSTGTLRLDPEGEESKIQKNPLYQAKEYKTLNNRCMELRKTCNHPCLNYPLVNELSTNLIVKSCGKLWVLDRILIKLQRTGHRVLLFSTMTKLLDILEDYLNLRRFVYRRIDGTTNLDDRESAIMDFNSPDSDSFIFLLSIRAAGRGLNLQSADTVVIYDPDPNPKNEEQAVARAHRIGQKREVKVIYLEAVVDKISSHQKEDELRSGGTVDMEDEFVGKDRYIGSVESLIRNNIQQYKIDMADEVINAGRFDQRTTHEERRLTLETLLHDEERYQENVHNVPSLQELNRLIARSDEEVELFDQMDEELDWPEEIMQHDEVPQWLRANTREVNAAIASLSKKPSKNMLGGNIGMDSEVGSERRRGRPKGKKHPNYKELEDENGEYSEASSEERNEYSAQEEGEIGEFEDDVYSGADGHQPEEDGLTSDAGYEIARSNARHNHVAEEAGSSGSSSDCQRLVQTVSPSVSAQKFASLSALDARPSSISKIMVLGLSFFDYFIILFGVSLFCFILIKYLGDTFARETTWRKGKLQYQVILTWIINSQAVGFMIVMRGKMNKFCRNPRSSGSVVFVFVPVILWKGLRTSLAVRWYLFNGENHPFWQTINIKCKQGLIRKQNHLETTMPASMIRMQHH